MIVLMDKIQINDLKKEFGNKKIIGFIDYIDDSEDRFGIVFEGNSLLNFSGKPIGLDTSKVNNPLETNARIENPNLPYKNDIVKKPVSTLFLKALITIIVITITLLLILYNENNSFRFFIQNLTTKLS